MRPPDKNDPNFLNARVIGAGPPLVIMHGLFGSSRNWLGHAKKLAAVAEVHLLDLRNHGQSPWFDEMDYRSMAQDLLQYLDARGIADAHIIGHSMGGKTAMQFALWWGNRIRRLIIADIAPVAYEHSYATHIEAMRRAPIQTGDRKGIENHLLEALQDETVVSFLMQNLMRDGRSYAWRVNIDAIADALPALLGSLQLDDARAFEGETLFLRGAKSDYVKPEHRKHIRELFPNGRVASLKDAGHWLHAEQPETFIRAVRGFLKLEAKSCA